LTAEVESQLFSLIFYKHAVVRLRTTKGEEEEGERTLMTRKFSIWEILNKLELSSEAAVVAQARKIVAIVPAREIKGLARRPKAEREDVIIVNIVASIK